MSKRDYYEILAVSRTASDGEIKAAYRKLAFSIIRTKIRAMRLPKKSLRNALRRILCFQMHKNELLTIASAIRQMRLQALIRDLRTWKTFSICSGSAICSVRGGRTRSTVQRGSDLRYDIEISLEEAAAGKEETIEIPRLEKCAECEGKGAEKGSSPIACTGCQGSGQTRYQQGFFSVMRTCPKCGGRGQIIKDPCKKCRGEGRIEKEKKIEIKIPAGVETGSRLRVTGEGEAGPGGGPSGDLFVVIHVKEHEIFERQGANLYSSVPVTFAPAALGGQNKSSDA